MHGVRGLFHNDADRTARGIAPVKRTLRPAQHLDPLYVKQSNVVDVLPGDIHVIDVGANWRVKCRDRFVVSLRTQVVHVGGSQARVVSAKQVGHYIDEVERVVNL